MRKMISNLLRALPLVAASFFCSTVPAEDLIRFQPGSVTVEPYPSSTTTASWLSIYTVSLLQPSLITITNEAVYTGPAVIPGGTISLMVPPASSTPEGAYVGAAVTARVPELNLTIGNSSTLSGFVLSDVPTPWPPPLPDPTLPDYFLGHYGGTVYHLRRGYYVYDGMFSFIVLKNHAYQGKITIDNQTYYFQGKTPADGHILTFITNRRTLYFLDLTLVQYGDNSVGCTGTVEQGHAEGQQGWTANLYGNRSR